jgi:ribosomal protein uL13
MTIIEGKGMVLGRLASVIAKRLLKNEVIDVVNCEKIVVIGDKTIVVEKFSKWLKMAPKGNPLKGPKFSRMPDKIVKRTIRGMLPWKQPKGKKAFKNLKIHIGVPEKFASTKPEIIESAKNHKQKGFVEIEEISKKLGAKW